MWVLAILTSRSYVRATKDLWGGSPTPSMKNGWLYRTSCDEKNHEIAPMVMIQIEWGSRSSDDVQWWSKSSDDPDPVMMIQIQWWSRSDNERWLEDEEDLKMKMTWRWRWRELDDDPDDTEKKTCAGKFCRENTFLVKRECWCNCNFGMYSLVFLMYCNPMFILGCICNVLESCHSPMFLSGVYVM